VVSGAVTLNKTASGDVLYLGGLVGHSVSGGVISASRVTGAVTADSSAGTTIYQGGMVGYNSGTLTISGAAAGSAAAYNSYVSGDVTMDHTGTSHLGGLVGHNLGAAHIS
jgi:hypothetical protein